jgi:hypothetical protein
MSNEAAVAATVNDIVAALTFDPDVVKSIVALSIAALETDQNIIIRLPHRGVGLLNEIGDAFRDASIRHAIYAADALHTSDLSGIPYLDETKNVVYSKPFFVRELTEETRKVIVLDEVQAAYPAIGEFIRQQGTRGRMILIFSNDYDYEKYADFPALRISF